MGTYLVRVLYETINELHPPTASIISRLLKLWNLLLCNVQVWIRIMGSFLQRDTESISEPHQITHIQMNTSRMHSLHCSQLMHSKDQTTV